MAQTRLPMIRNTIQSDAVQSGIKARIGQKAGTFTTSLLDVIGEDPLLEQCDPNLIVKQALKAAALDLPLNRNLGFAYVLPYKNKGVYEPNFQMGYRGYIQLAIRTGQYKHLNAAAVFEGETVEVDKIQGTMKITGEPTSDTIIGFFSYMKLLNGFEKAIFWTADKVRAHGQKYSKAYDAYLKGKSKWKPVWETDFEGMGKKTMILALVPKYGPMSIQMTEAFAAEGRVDFKGFGSVQDEINNNANEEVIDIDPGSDEETPMTEEEMEEIKAQEAAEAENERKPSFMKN